MILENITELKEDLFINNKKYKIEMLKNNSVYDFDINYFLISNEKIFEGKNIKFFSIYVSLYDKNTNEKENKLVEDISSDFEFIKNMFLTFYQNIITPMSLYDCTYDFLIKKYG